MFQRLGQFVARRWGAVLFAWAVLAGAVHLAAPRWDSITHDGDLAYLPSRMTSVAGERLLERAFPDAHSRSQIVFIVARSDGKLGRPDFGIAERLLEKYGRVAGQADQPILAVWSYESDVIGGKLISRPGYAGQAVLIVLKLSTELMAIGNLPLLAEVYETLDAIRAEPGFPEGLELGVTGSAAIGADMLFSAEESIRNTEVMTIVLVVAILLLVYRAPGLIVVPLITILVSVFVATDLVALLARLSEFSGWFDFKVFKTTRIFIVVILYGAGTDFCLFLIARYREELAKLLPPKEAIARALGQVGNALAASALTTIIGLGMMVFAEFGKFRNGGPAIGLCLAVALLACVTLAPALLRAFGTAVFWPWGVGGGSAARRPGAAPVHGMEAGWECLGAADSAAAGARSFGLWDHISRLVLARPGAILLLAMALMAVPAWFGSDVPITYDLLNELQPDRPSVQGTQILRRHFLPGEIGPTTLVAHRPGADFLSEKGQQQIARLTKELYDFEWADLSDQVVRPIVSVRSLTEPLGDPPGTFNPLTAAGRQKLIVLKNPQTKRAFVSDAPPLLGSVTRFDLIFAYDPFSRESVALLGEVERRVQQMAADPASAWHGTEFAFSGATPGIRDLQAINQTDRIRIQVLVVAAVLLVLIAILGHPWICLGLVLSVVWGYLVTMGITRAVFAALHPDSFYGLDWKVPIFLFVILVAVGADYNIYLVTRALEEQKRRGSFEGLRVAMVRTGGIITSCGLIMAGTFAAMGAGTLRAMQELGFALALGVLLDTFVIRTVLVPAMLALMARRASAQEASSPSD